MKVTFKYTNEEFKRIESLLASLGVDREDINVIRNFKKISNNIISVMMIPSENEMVIDADPAKLTIPCIKALKPVFGLVKNCCEIINDLMSDIRQDWGKFEITDLHLEPAESGKKKETKDDAECKSLTPVDVNTSTTPAEVMVIEKKKD